MPRLPDIDSLGARPVPQSRRGIASVRNAGAVGDAVSGFGATVANIGGRMLEKEDKLTYGAARSAYLSADIAARQELQDDPDYATFEARYNERMAKARAAATGLIGSKSDRRIFEVDSRLDLDRGLGEVRSLARSKRVAAEGSIAYGSLTKLREVARLAQDDATREAAIGSANELIQGAEARGVFDPERGRQLRQAFASDHASEVINSEIDGGDPEQAAAKFAKWGRYLDSQSFIALGRAVDRMRDDKLVMGAADVGLSAIATDEVPDSGSAPLLPVQGTVTSGLGDARPGGRTHKGIDLEVPVGTPVRASGWGTVLKRWNDTHHGGGLSMLVDYGGGLVMGYAHLSEQGLNEGDPVRPGQVIARSGNTGRSTGAHLHWSARQDGKPVDPRTVRAAGGAAGASRAPPSLGSAIKAAVAALGPSPAPGMVEAVRREVETRWRIAEADEAERDESVIEAIQTELVKNGGDWRGLPQAVKNKLPAKYHDDMARFGDAIKAPDGETDPSEYVRLTEMAHAKPKEFARINPVTYRDKFDATDWERLVSYRNQILGTQATRVDSPSIAEIRSATTSALEAVGITTTGLTETKDKDGSQRRTMNARIYQFEKAIVSDVEAWQRANPGKKPAPADIQAMADKRLIPMALAGGRYARQFEARGPGAIKVPTADYNRIVKIMTPILRRPPSGTEVAQAYLREARGGL